MEARKNKIDMKKQSTTKFVTFFMLALTTIVTVAGIVATFLLNDTTILVTLIPCIFAECGVVTGFYFWIRKVRSIIELKFEYGEEFIEHTLDDL